MGISTIKPIILLLCLLFNPLLLLGQNDKTKDVDKDGNSMSEPVITGSAAVTSTNSLFQSDLFFTQELKLFDLERLVETRLQMEEEAIYSKRFESSNTNVIAYSLKVILEGFEEPEGQIIDGKREGLWIFNSGSNVDAADVGEHFSRDAGLVVPTGDARNSAECASGGVVQCRGKVVIEGPIDGQATTIPFRDMKIKMPIASMKKRVEGADGYDVFITEAGAVMRHRKNGALVKSTTVEEYVLQSSRRSFLMQIPKNRIRFLSGGAEQGRHSMSTLLR